MDPITKFLYKVSHKFPKGYPDITVKEDRELLDQLLIEVLTLNEVSDREISRNTAQAIEHILSNADSSLGFKKQNDKKRLGNPKKVHPEKVQQIFKDLLGADKITIHGPRSGPNPSGKFDMYEFESKDFGLVRIILSGGGNAGEKYEQEFVAKSKAAAGDNNSNLPADLQTLYKELGIDNTKLTPDDIDFAGASDTKRSLSFAGPQDIGKTISDMTINYGGKEYYISLKNKAGSGVYSGKSVPFIRMEDNKVIYDSSKDTATPNIDTLFNMFSIDRQRLADGINDYINQTGEIDGYSSVNIDTDKFKKFLASSLGYGYYYVREKGKGDVKVVPILTAEDAEKAIGTIKNAEIKYPGPNTKQLGIKVDTDSPTFGPSQYFVAVRNTAGKVLPLSLRISKIK